MNGAIIITKILMQVLLPQIANKVKMQLSTVTFISPDMKETMIYINHRMHYLEQMLQNLWRYIHQSKTKVLK